MIKAEKMQDRSPELPATRRDTEKKRCYQCDGRFGLIRNRFALKQFCSKHCLNEYKSGTKYKMSLLKEWRDFYNQKR
jgi:hypothetical protein